MTVYDLARDAYLAEHPTPEPNWFRCPRCKAEPGQPCQGRVRRDAFHTQRQDMSINGHRLRSLDAANHADNRLNELEGIGQRLRTDHHLKYLQRVGARPQTKESQ